MIPLTWKVRAYESINRWQPTLDWEKLYAAIDRVSSKVIGSAMKSSLMCKFNLVAKTIETLACDCTTNDATGSCFASAQVPLFEQQFFSGLSNSADNVLGSISVTPTSVPAISDSATVKVYSVTTTTPTQIVSRHFLKSPYEPNEYEVVMNHAAYIVGQLVGGGVTIDIPEGVTINVCLNLDPDIPVDPEMIYPIADFGGYNATATGEAGDPNYWPDNLDVTVLTGPDRYCADVNESGTYFPIRRLADWETATGIPPTPQPTSAPTAAPTSAPTALTSAPTAPAPTVAPTTLNGVAITGIVIACVFATILIILLIMYCVRMCKEPQAYLEMEKELRIGRKIRRPIRRPLRGHGLKQV